MGYVLVFTVSSPYLQNKTKIKQRKIAIYIMLLINKYYTNKYLQRINNILIFLMY